MSYKHDIFISYRRDPLHVEWLEEHFLPIFRALIWQDIAARCKRPLQGIFFDQTELSAQTRRFNQQGIEPGDDWRAALGEAIKSSRCVLALWSPMYFYSDWCLTEWASFVARGEMVKRKLVIPVSVHDGDDFPEDARKAQFDTLSDYVIVGAGFRRTDLFVDFQKRMRLLAQHVAAVVCEAPDFEDWPISPPRPRSDGPEITLTRL